MGLRAALSPSGLIGNALANVITLRDYLGKDIFSGGAGSDLGAGFAVGGAILPGSPTTTVGFMICPGDTVISIDQVVSGFRCR